MPKILFILATHGDEGYSIPVMEKIAKKYPKSQYNYDWVIGNPQALDKGIRFTEKDLNRSAPGSLKSKYYEERRAAELVELSRKFDYVIDIHGSTGDCGVTTITPLPTANNLQLAATVGVDKNVIWYSAASDIAGPIVQHTHCPGIEIECGPKYSPTIAKQLYSTLEKLLIKNSKANILETAETNAKFYEVYGVQSGKHDPAIKDFKPVTMPNGETFVPYMSNQYPKITCYKMRQTKQLVFLDIDGTLLDATYRSNDDSLKSAILRKQKEGVVFSLNSNRALEDLLPIAERFGVKGPLIGENGLFAYHPATGKTTYFVDGKTLKSLAATKVMTQKLIKAELEDYFQGRTVIWQDVDTVNARPEANRTYPDGAVVALNNMFRKYTVSVHIKLCVNGRLTPASKDMSKIAKKVQAKNNNAGVAIAYSKDFSNILVYSAKASKRHAVEQLRGTEYAGYQLYAIGDELSDYKMVETIGTFMTVNNAVLSVKTKAQVCSKSNYAKGVHELIQSQF